MLRAFVRRLMAWFRGDPPVDPHAYVAAPLRRGPAGRASAVALEEPPAPSRIDAVGRRRMQRPNGRGV